VFIFNTCNLDNLNVEPGICRRNLYSLTFQRQKVFTRNFQVSATFHIKVLFKGLEVSNSG